MSAENRPAVAGLRELSGSLAARSLPDVVRELYARRLSGGLQLVREREQRVIFFVEGEVKSALSNLRRQKIGQHLVSQKLVAEDTVTRAMGKMTPGKRMGKLLVEEGAISAEDLDRQIEELVRDIIYGAFCWTEGKYQFVPNTNPIPSDIRLNLSTADIILEACRRLPDEANESIVDRAFASTNLVLEPNEDPLFRFQHATLTPTEQFIMSRIDGVTPVGALLKLFPLPPREVKRSLFGLVSCGILRDKGAPVPVAAAGSAKASDFRAQIQVVPDDDTDEKRKVRRQRIEALYNSLGKINYYEILECPKRATQKEIRMGFMRLSALYHPDLHLKPTFGDLKEKLTAIFQHLEEAYDTLVDTERRQMYDRTHRLGSYLSG